MDQDKLHKADTSDTDTPPPADETGEQARAEGADTAPWETGGPDSPAPEETQSPVLSHAPDMPPRVTEVEPRRSAVWAMLLGGALAAAMGFGAAWVLREGSASQLSAYEARIGAQQQAISVLESRIADLPGAPDLTPIQEEIAALRADVVAQTEGLRPALDALASRVDALERAPLPDGSLSETAIATWQADIDALRAGLADQATRIDTLAAEAEARSSATAEDIAQIEAEAVAAAQDVARRGAVARILAALDAGTPFVDALADVTADGSTAPTALAGLAESGAPTPAQLAAAFPDAARAALSTARDEGLADDGEGWRGFFANVLDVRSTAPREGDDPDAILSRAEAALRENRLDDALAEIAALPEVVRGAMASWLALAEARQTALREANDLAATMTDNEG